MDIQLPSPTYPQISARLEYPFFQDLVNGEITMADLIYSLIKNRRDLKMWYRFGSTPHSDWSAQSVKEYFGLKGSKEEELLKQLDLLETEFSSMTKL